METIKSSREIDRIFREGVKVTTPLFILIRHETPSGRDPMGRVAFIAGKKLGSAPERSRCKRLLRESIRRLGCSWPGIDVIFVATAKLKSTTLVDLQDYCVRALKQADLLEATA